MHRPASRHLLFLACLIVLLCADGAEAMQIRQVAVVPVITRSISGHSQLVGYSHHGVDRSCPGCHNGGHPRPLPTPCRNQSTPAIPCVHSVVPAWPTDDFANQDSLVTLLQQSAARQDCQAFFLAATLLELLVEERIGTAVEARATASCPGQWGSPEPRPISLSQSLPRSIQHDLAHVSLNIGRSLDDLRPLLGTRWPLDSELPDDLVLHPATKYALANSIDLPGEDKLPVQTHVYTDGAFNGKRSAWAFAVVDVFPEGYCLRGWLRGDVALSGNPLYIGAAEHSAIEAERTALFWAVAWTLQQANGNICVWSDSLVASGQTSGQWGSTDCSCLAAGPLHRQLRLPGMSFFQPLDMSKPMQGIPSMS